MKKVKAKRDVPYEFVLETALLLACMDNADHDTSKPEVLQYLVAFYLDKAVGIAEEKIAEKSKIILTNA